MDRQERIETKLDLLIDVVASIKTDIAVGNQKHLTLEIRIARVEIELQKIRDEALPARKLEFTFHQFIKVFGWLLGIIAMSFGILKFLK